MINAVGFISGRSKLTSVSLLPGVPAGPQRHHPQFAPGSGTVVGHHAKAGSACRTQDGHMTEPKHPSKSLMQRHRGAKVTGLKSCLQ